VLQLMRASSGDQDVEVSELVGAVASRVQARRRKRSGPRCPECAASLDDVARFRTMVVRSDSEDTGIEPRMVDVVDCRRCGATLLVDNSRPVDE